MVNAVSGIDYRDWKPIDASSAAKNDTSTSTVKDYDNDSYQSSANGEKCTDGKDDGKIGFFSAIANTVKGIGKTVVNAVKGMVTDKDGNFSLGKTLLSVGAAALCVAVPGLGVAACAVGGVMGAIQIGKGVYKAATAETDAEAKEAWQNIGGGAFTVGMSVFGAKAGVKAMKTAAGNTAEGSALQALENAGSKLSSKTAGQYAKAFLKDSYSSGKYNLSQIRAELGSSVEALKIRNLEKKVENMEGGLTAKEVKLQNELNARKAFASDKTLAKLSKLENTKTTLGEKASSLADAAQHPFKTAHKALDSDMASKALNAVKHPIKTLKSIPSTLSPIAKEIIKDIKSTDSSYAQLVGKYGYENVAEVLKLFGGIAAANETV